MIWKIASPASAYRWGIAIGPAFIIEQSGVPVPEYEIPSAQVEKELKRLHGAITKVQKHLGQLRQKAETLPAGAEDMVLLLDAYKGMLTGSPPCARCRRYYHQAAHQCRSRHHKNKSARLKPASPR